MLISVYWEVLEVYIEDGLIFSEISFWFSGKENFFNRFFSDQLTILIGFLVIKFNPKLYYWFVVFIFLFVLFHIYVGTSTYLI